MKIIRNIKELKINIQGVKNLGFVPTMGGFHKGHLSLIKKSINKCNKTLVSIYVNPAQFNNKKDFSNYPRNISKDINILKNKNVDYLFIPRTSEIYKNKKNKKIIIKGKKKILCGKYRKGHFEGVIDVINRFLNIIDPKYMFLGEKDYQQLFLIKKNIKKKFIVKIISCKTIRDNNFLALSSRNNLLSKKNLKMSGEIAKKLYLFKKKIVKNYKYKNQISFYKKYLTKKYNIKIEYLEARKEKDLTTLKNKSNFRLFVAYYVNDVRLIDNY
tara:strand:- start:27 stop:839 length:813 start_codon:yes stop_codon:yes gene_type:complete